METGETKYGADPLAVPGLHRDGSTMSLEFSIMMLHDDAGRIEGIAAILRDVSKRWKRRRSCAPGPRAGVAETLEQAKIRGVLNVHRK